MPFPITGKTAIVTGAARGVALANAGQFGEQGANVVFVGMGVGALSRAAIPARCG